MILIILLMITMISIIPIIMIIMITIIMILDHSTSGRAGVGLVNDSRLDARSPREDLGQGL